MAVDLRPAKPASVITPRGTVPAKPKEPAVLPAPWFTREVAGVSVSGRF